MEPSAKELNTIDLILMASGKLTRDEMSALRGINDAYKNEAKYYKDLLRVTDGMIRMALDELGVPQPDYPAPVSNAIEILTDIRAKLKPLTERK